MPRLLAVSGSQGRIISGPCHCCPPGLSAFCHLGERFRSIGPISDRSALALMDHKSLYEGMGEWIGI